MKPTQFILLTMAAFGTLTISGFNAFAAADADSPEKVSITGTIQGLSFVTDGKIYPLAPDDPLAGHERAFILVPEDDNTDYVILADLDRRMLIRNLGQKAKVYGDFFRKYGRNHVNATRLEVEDGTGWIAEWSLKIQQEQERLWYPDGP